MSVLKIINATNVLEKLLEDFIVAYYFLFVCLKLTKINFLNFQQNPQNVNINNLQDFFNSIYYKRFSSK